MALPFNSDSPGNAESRGGALDFFRLSVPGRTVNVT